MAPTENQSSHGGKDTLVMTREHTLNALDFSSGRLTAFTGRVRAGRRLEVMAAAQEPLRGLRRDCLLSEEVLSAVLQKLLLRPGLSQSRTSGPWVVVLGNSACRGARLRGRLTISTRNRAPLEEVILTAVEQMAVQSLGPERHLIKVLPLQAKIEHHHPQEKKTKVQAETLAIFTSRPLITGLTGIMRKLSLTPSYFTMNALAGVNLITTSEHRQLGFTYLNLGWHTTTALVFEQGVCRFCETYAQGIELLSSDLAYMLQTGEEEARSLLDNHASLEEEEALPRELVPVPTRGQGISRRVSHQVLQDIIGARLTEIILEVKADLQQRTGFPGYGLGVFLGGLGSRLPGVEDFLQRLLDVPVRRGELPPLEGDSRIINDPAYMGALGACFRVRERIPVEQVEAMCRNETC
jgi:cell division protein FtsA